MPLKTAKEPFKFYTRLNMSELTGLKAGNLKEFLSHIKKVPGSCIYHHTHRFLQQHQFLSPEPPNDFAYWTTKVLGEEALGEKLASIDIVQFSKIRALRERIISVIEEYLKNSPKAALKFAGQGEEFYFIKSVSFVIPTDYTASNLKEFMEILNKITSDSIYFHVFEARLRLEKSINDFSNWLEDSLGYKDVADAVSKLDPYTYTLEDLRKAIIKTMERKLAE